jgi:hypothetical protein
MSHDRSFPWIFHHNEIAFSGSAININDYSGVVNSTVKPNLLQLMITLCVCVEFEDITETKKGIRISMY